MSRCRERRRAAVQATEQRRRTEATKNSERSNMKFTITVENIEDTWTAETVGLKFDGENEAFAESTDSITQCLVNLACDIQDRAVMFAEDALATKEPAQEETE